ncbi:MAG: hypothetical protein H0W87_00490 [Actinobacteria bacterium]|nr:hypothetical protein [Actinomycetota bacterium]
MFTLRHLSSLLIAVAGAAALLLSGTAAAVPWAKPGHALHLQRLAHADPGEGYSGDVFGHLGYAYLSSWHGAACPSDGVRVYDVHTPSKPKRVATFADVGSQPRVERTWTEKTIVQHTSTASFKGELAVVSFQGCGGNSFQGFGLYDVTDPAHPKPLSLTHLEPRGSHEIWLQSARGHAYVYTAIPRSEVLSSPDFNPQTQQAQTPGDPDFRIFDVTDPSHPVQVGDWGAWKELGVRPWQGRGHFSANFVHSVITNAAATRAFLSYWDLGTVILDVRDPSHPHYLGRTPATDDEGDAHSAALARNGTVLIETHETADGHPTLFDISNPALPKKLSDFRLPAKPGGAGFTNGVHDPKVLGNRAYFSWYSRGVVAADISNPRKPRLIAQFTPPVSPDPEHVLCDTASCRLVWGVYAEKNYVLASDMLSGLWVLRLK